MMGFAQKYEARISKSETKPKVEIQNAGVRIVLGRISFSCFAIVSDFVLRISNFWAELA